MKDEKEAYEDFCELKNWLHSHFESPFDAIQLSLMVCLSIMEDSAEVSNVSFKEKALPTITTIVKLLLDTMPPKEAVMKH